jgi:hypothetical protein
MACSCSSLAFCPLPPVSLSVSSNTSSEDCTLQARPSAPRWRIADPIRRRGCCAEVAVALTDAGDVEDGSSREVAVKAAAQAGKVDRRRIKPPGEETRASDH